MDDIYLGLGSNTGDRFNTLQQAVALLNERGIRFTRLSPVVESPALLPDGAPAEWNRPFLNMAAEVRFDGPPYECLKHLQAVEQQLGREKITRWSPRTIDIDILLWGQMVLREEQLTIPHPQLHKRNFVLSSLLHLNPGFKVPGLDNKTLFQWSQMLDHHIPLWMGIINVTPDSFSDGGAHVDWLAVETTLDKMQVAGVNIIDLGAESTRPGAAAVSPDEEWSRLQPVLSAIQDKWSVHDWRPYISIDTRNPETAEKALNWGADMINDVSGLSQPAMQSLARDSKADWVAMHSLTVPVDKKVTLNETCDPFAEIQSWLQQRMDDWTKAGLDLDRIIFDPGIGFGKNSLQSLKLLRRAGELRQHGLRILIGHSRKSFMTSFTKPPAGERDWATVGASLQLCEQNVDILRVHNVPAHIEAYRAWQHLQPAI
ncbi:MAG: dihydropteroate synthase [Pseudomonadota bacterium]